jgi:hypothetical protein
MIVCRIGSWGWLFLYLEPRSQSYDRELQRERTKILQHNK